MLAGLVWSQQIQAEELRPMPEKFIDQSSGKSQAVYSVPLKAGETQWFRMKAVEEKGYFRVQMRRSQLYPLVRIYVADRDGNGLKEVASNEKMERNNVQKDVILHVPLNEKDRDEYYVSVEGVKGSTGSFGIRFSQPATPREDDYPDTKKDADVIVFDKGGKGRLTGSIDPVGDNDWFTFTVDKPGYVTTGVYFPNKSKLDIHLRLHNEKVLVLQLAPEELEMKRQVKAGEQYWLHVRAGSALSERELEAGREPTGDYTLLFNYEREEE
jgi:hypothetical protein